MVSKMNKIKLGSRIVQQTRYTRWISLPIVWLDNNEIQKGGKIWCEMLPDGNLVLQPGGK